MSKELTFEEALAKLEGIVKELENGKQTLEKTIELFGEGIFLSQFCHRQLEQAEQKITLLTTDANGEVIFKEYTGD